MNKIKYPRKIDNLFQLSFGEEVGNTISHGVPALLLLISGPFLAVRGYIKGGWLLAISTAIFTLSLFLMFLASTLYHAMDFHSPHKKVFRILDHIMIYFAIAGTFTPVCLNVIKGPLGLTIVILQWIFVLFGILYKSIMYKKNAQSEHHSIFSHGLVSHLVSPYSDSFTKLATHYINRTRWYSLYHWGLFL